MQGLRPLLTSSDRTLHGVPVYITHEATNQRYRLVTKPAGEPLTARMLEDGFLPLETCFEYGLKLLTVLKEVHMAGVIHCDVHPGNLVVVGDQLLLVDWELSQRVQDVTPVSHLVGVGSISLLFSPPLA